MAPDRRLAGTISVQINGEVQDAAGDFTYNLGAPRLEALVGHDGFHGFKETPQVAFIEGTIRDRSRLDLQTLVGAAHLTVVLQLANKKVIRLHQAAFAGAGTGSTGAATIDVRFEGRYAEEIRPPI